MLIPLELIIKKYNITSNGVMFCGANSGQEAGDFYRNNFVRSIWVEAIPKVYEQLKYNISFSPNAKAFNECVSDTDGQSVEFKVTDNNGESSSMLDFGTHKEHYPQIKVAETITCITKKLDTLISENNIDICNYDFLVMDLQGAELLALKGMKDNLRKVNFAYLEVNRAELYVGCAKVEQLDEFLLEYGFKRVEVYWDSNNWGDAFYIKQNS